MAKKRKPRSSEARTWDGVKSCCRNPKDEEYRLFGGVGIQLDERWNSFATFSKDMGPRPSPLHCLVRIDKRGHFCKENCKWEVKELQRQSTCDGITGRISLGKSAFAIVDAADFPSLVIHKWCKSNCGYAISRLSGIGKRRNHVYMHRLLMNPSGRMEVDHINGDRLDNRRSNLRLATHAQNSYNKTPSGALKGVTVSSNGKKFLARISPCGQSIRLGTFDTASEAHAAYCAAALMHYGPYSRFK